MCLRSVLCTRLSAAGGVSAAGCLQTGLRARLISPEYSPRLPARLAGALHARRSGNIFSGREPGAPFPDIRGHTTADRPHATLQAGRLCLSGPGPAGCQHRGLAVRTGPRLSGPEPCQDRGAGCQDRGRLSGPEPAIRTGAGYQDRGRLSGPRPAIRTGAAQNRTFPEVSGIFRRLPDISGPAKICIPYGVSSR